VRTLESIEAEDVVFPVRKRQRRHKAFPTVSLRYRCTGSLHPIPLGAGLRKIPRWGGGVEDFFPTFALDQFQ
jgi:hypothetical protein